MRLYSDFATQRTRQIVGDVVALAILVVGIAVAVTLRNAIAAFDAIGRDVEASGQGISATMTDIGETLSGTPFIGGGIRAPFDAASGAGGSLAAAGQSWQTGVQTLANVTGWTIALLVVLVVALAWLRPRLAGAVRRGAVARSAAAPGSMELLALRALTERPAREVLAVDPAVVPAWLRGDPDVTRRLAALELRAAGVKARG